MPLPTALITGASRGIGRATALRLAGQYEIVALARDASQLEALASAVAAAGGRCRTIVADLRDGAATEAALAGLEADVVVNNAGVGFTKPLVELSPEEWHAMIDVNLNALYHVTRVVLPGMMQRRRGHVVIVGSIAGRSAFVGGSGYGATKHAVMGFAESLMLEVRDAGVRVSVVNPGSVNTEFSPKEGRDTSWMLRAEDVADSIAFALDAPAHVLLHRIEVRASAPKKG